MQWGKWGKPCIIIWTCILVDEYDMGDEHGMLDWIPCFWCLDAIRCLS